jgi:hypothetical protein
MSNLSPARHATIEEESVSPHYDEPKYSTPPSGSSSYNWLRKDLDQKADKEWVEAKLEVLRGREEDTKQIAVRAKEKAGMPHDCNKKDVIEKLEIELTSWSRWLRGILVSAIGFLVLIGSGWLYQYFALTEKVNDTQTALVSIETKVNGVESSQRDLKIIIEKQSKKEEDSQKIRMDEIKTVLSQAVKDLNNSSEIRDLRRTR